MKSARIDSIARLLGQRQSRRTALQASGLGLAASLGVPRLARAQEATPEPFPDDPHPSAGTVARTEFLFTQSFQSGTWGPKEGEEGVYTLTLADVPPQIVYFSDRPERIFGTMPTQQFLDGLGFTPENPPNAALVAQVDATATEEEILVIELLNPVYDPDSATMTYDAVVLADYSGTGLDHAAQQQQDDSLPAEFAHGSLFIDDCAANQLDCYNRSDELCGHVWVETCWDQWAGTCEICAGIDPLQVCRSAFADCIDQ